MDIQKIANEHNNAVEMKILIDKQLENLDNRGQINFDLLPYEIAKELKRHNLKELKEYSDYFERELTELSVWLDTAVEREREEQKQIKIENGMV